MTGVGADCVTDTWTPVIEILAERAAPRLAAIARLTVAGPVPEVVTPAVTHGGNPEIAQEHEEAPWKITVRVPPAAGNWKPDGFAV